jgi:hypothetical protein
LELSWIDDLHTAAGSTHYRVFEDREVKAPSRRAAEAIPMLDIEQPVSIGAP